MTKPRLNYDRLASTYDKRFVDDRTEEIKEETVLKKDEKVGDKSFFSSTKYKDISEIERKVDRILLENKDRLDKVDLESFDIENFSLKNKDGESIYFFRKDSKEKPLKTNKDTEKVDGKTEKNKEKKMIFDIENLVEIVKPVPKGKVKTRNKEV